MVVYYTAGMMHMMKKRLLRPGARPSAGGFTLLETLIATTILAILLMVSMPSFTTFYSNQRLIGAAEQVYNHLQQARTESVTRGQTVYVNFSAAGTTTWTYGMSSITSSCDLTKTAATDTGACVMVVNDGDSTVHGVSGGTDTDDLVLYRFASTDYTGVSMSVTGGPEFTFTALRGMASAAGQVLLTGDNGNRLRVDVSLLGRVKLCSPSSSVQGYPAC